ncbi:DNA cytosine methyltransferase [Nitrosococcus wardiae]|uniref:DNA (cytosine-5-)-methyltransferase n=1 Tax=Nitrosococcus wardiae TaxID=1814290 RepID=A0A4P7C270_9GAMM|nr:DNA cytosine methyltransferase [Nitrosococcus wardiae]QBQ54936.1 DNA cytosine methyltransferase [Nitrosococcus wardiae]
MSINASVVDLFCGAGGLSHGFILESMPVAAGVDIDESCRYAYEYNNRAPFVKRDVATLKPQEIENLFYKHKRRILAGCAPCQPFSVYNQKNNNPNWQLLADFGNLVDYVRPDVVSMENVPRLLKFWEGRVFLNFINILRKADYYITWDIVYCPDYGLPQKRSRLVLLASRLGPITLSKPMHTKKYLTVRDAIGNLKSIDAGEIDSSDPLHHASRLSETNLKRIKNSRPGGSWRDWDSNLIANCHQENSGRGYASVYGRMVWDEPSPTITTQFYGFGNGRFGHPEQDRALSLREGAILQGFPMDYQFVEPGRPIYFAKLGRMIGNAVPVELGRVVARSIKQHLKAYE